MSYFSEAARRAINAAHGEKMTDWEGRRASDHKDVYSRDRYMPIEDANVSRHYRAKGGEIPELESKRGGHTTRRRHHADGEEVASRRGGHLRHHHADGEEVSRRRGGHTARRHHHADGEEVSRRRGGHTARRHHHADGEEVSRRKGGNMKHPRDMYKGFEDGGVHVLKGIKHCR